MKLIKSTKALIAISSAFLLVSFATATTLAFLTDTQTTENKMTVGDVDILLSEPAFEELTDDGRTIPPLAPEDFVTKDPFVVNQGKNDAYVRLKVTIPTVTINGSQEALFNLYTGDLDNPVEGFNDTNWETREDLTPTVDGVTYYYYKDVLPARAADAADTDPLPQTEKLFDLVQLNPDLEEGTVAVDEDGNANANITIVAEAIQASNLGDENPWQAFDEQ